MSEVTEQIAALEGEIFELTRKLHALRRTNGPVEVPNYSFETQNGEATLLDLFGDHGAIVWDVDTSIVSRGALIKRHEHTAVPFFSLATIEFPRLGNLTMASLRLRPGSSDIRLWAPECWRSHAVARDIHRKQLRRFLEAAESSGLELVAGDFNAPQGDPVYALLPANLRDAFAHGGVGLGNTILNDLPVLRIDQIRADPAFPVLQSFAVKSRVSDHRLVVTDLLYPRRPTRPPGAGFSQDENEHDRSAKRPANDTTGPAGQRAGRTKTTTIVAQNVPRTTRRDRRVIVRAHAEAETEWRFSTARLPGSIPGG